MQILSETSNVDTRALINRSIYYRYVGAVFEKTSFVKGKEEECSEEESE